MSDYNQTRSFNFGIANELSIEAALVFDEVSFWATKNKSGWVYKSLDDLSERLPIKPRTMRRSIDKLIAAGYLEKKIVKANGLPTMHFKILKQLGFGQNGQNVLAKMDNPLVLAKMDKSITATTHSNYTTATASPVLASGLEEFLEHRKEIRKKLTPRAYNLVLLKLEHLAPGDDSAKIAILNQSIESGWSGIFPLKADSQVQTKPKGMVY